jgi:xyloglucan-specific exo-beta-1,4-glucanase
MILFNRSRARKVRAVCAVAIALFSSASALAQSASPFKWSSVNTQGMGYVTGLVIHEKFPHQRYIRTDVGGVYRYDATGAGAWVNTCDTFSRLQNDVCDVESVAVDSVNPDRVWKAAPLGREFVGNTDEVISKGEVLVSDNRGVSWKPTGLAANNIYMGGNDDFRGMTGERLLIDPFNANRAYFASRKQGLWRYDNSAWAKVSGLPDAAQPGINFIVVDRSAGQANGGARVLYAGVYGQGVWRSDTAGTTWSQVAGSPNAYPLRAAVSPTGTLFVTYGGDEGGALNGTKIEGGVWRLKAGAWTRMAPDAEKATYSGVAIDPANANHVLVARGGARKIFRSANGGDTWAEMAKSPLQNEPAYYPKPKPSNYNLPVGEWGNAALVFDPGVIDTVWQTNGFGVITTANVNAASPTWSWSMRGLEELVIRGVKAPPARADNPAESAELLSVVADMIGFRHVNVGTVPSSTLAPIDFVAGATGLDYAGQKSQYAAFVGWDQDKGGWWAVRSGFSSDNGKSFTPFANTSPGSGGIIAMSATNPDNMVWAPTRWAKPAVTFDRGQTWQVIKRKDGSDVPASFRLSNEWWNGQVLVADRIDGNRFYYLESGRFYTSADGGRTWEGSPKEVWQMGMPPWWTLAANVVVNPARSGQLFATFAANRNQREAFKMFRSDDFGMSFSPVESAAVVNFAAFGKGDADNAPYLYIHGRVNAATADGIYRSKDLGVSWELVSTPSENQFGKINSMDASKVKKNVVYIGTGGRGMFVGVGDDQPPPPPPYYGRAVNTGGAAAGNFKTDEGADAGNTFATTRAIKTEGVTDAAPQAVYQSERYGGKFTYTSPVLAEGRRYKVRVHFAEIYWGVAGLGGANTGAGQRVFNVSVSNMRQPQTVVLSGVDIFKEAGGANRALVREFEAYSDGTGSMKITFESLATSPDRNAKVSGIEFIELGF